MRRILIVISAVFVLNLLGFAQPGIRFEHYSMSDGLSNQVVKTIFQDQDGFIWIGTDDGLNRFDGRTFKHFRHDPADTHSISGNQIVDIKEFANGDLVIGTRDGGLTRFDRHEKKFTAYDLNSVEAEEDNLQKISCFGFDRDSTLWVHVHYNPLIQIFPNGMIESHAEDTSVFQNHRIYAMTLTSDGRFLASQLGRGVLEFGHDKWAALYSGYSYPRPAHTINCFHEQDGELWMGGWDNGLHKLSGDSVETVLYLGKDEIDYSGEEIYCINGYDRYLWMGTRFSGLKVLDKQTGNLTEYHPSLADPKSISSTSIHCMFRDRDGRMWVGTDKGIDLFDPNEDQFEIIYPAGDRMLANSSEKITCALKVDSALYLGSTEGLWVKSNGDAEFIHKQYSTVNGFLQVHSLHRDKQGRILVGTNQSVYVLSPEDLTISEFNAFITWSGAEEGNFNFFNILASRAVSIAESRIGGRDVIWTSIYGHGLGLTNAANLNTIIALPATTGKSNNRISFNLVHRIKTDSQENVWLLGDDRGVVINPVLSNSDAANFAWQNPKQGVVKVLPKDPIILKYDQGENQFLNGVNTRDMVETYEGTVYITTYGKGLVRCDIQGAEKSFDFIDSPHLLLEGIEKDRDGNLWIITSGGIDKFYPRTKMWQHFDHRDGFPKTGLEGDILLDGDHMIASGMGFVIRFDPLSVGATSVSSRQLITGLTVDGVEVDSLLRKDHIRFTHTQNTLSFEFACLNYTDPDKNQFAYRLLGGEQNWIYCGTDNHVRYANLPGGDYTFQVKSANQHGSWNEIPAEFSFTIVPVFWQQTWFILLSIFFVSLLIAGYFYFRLRRIRRLQLQQIRIEGDVLERERERFSRELHDDISTRMSVLKLYLSSMDELIVSDDAHEVNQKAQSVIDESLVSLRELMQNVSPEVVTRHGLFSAISNFANHITSLGRVEVICELPEKRIISDTRLELSLYRIVQELLNNALKHANCDVIRLSIRRQGNQLILKYSDNGDKIVSTIHQKHSGFGLQNIENRVATLSGAVRWKTDPSPGFGVEIIIPIQMADD